MSILARFFAPSRPDVAVEIGSRHVAALRLRPGTPPGLAAHAVEPLPDGLVVPSMTARNLADPAAVSAVVGRVLKAVGGARQVALVVPDPVARVSIVRFEQTPPERDLEAMLRWHVRKSVPFKMEDALLTWTPGATPAGGGAAFVTVVAQRAVVREYEQACTAAGAHPGIVDLATLNLVNLELAARGGEGDWLLVHLAADYLSMAIVRGGALIFFRHRGAEEAVELADLVHQTAMYYEDRLDGRGFARVVLAAAGRRAVSGDAALEPLRRTLEERLRTRIEPIDASRALAAVGRQVPDQLAPLAGILLREAA
ncbi:MAG TPA: pilus assembly protein PilM [Vicinamibacterales bacterium]